MQTIGEGDPLKHGLICRLTPEEVKLVRGVMLRLRGAPGTRIKIANDIVAALHQAGVPLTSVVRANLEGEITTT